MIPSLRWSSWMALILSGLTLISTAEKPKHVVPATTGEPKVRTDPVELASMCVALEPKVLATVTSHALVGVRQTILSPATEQAAGLKMFSEKEWAALGVTWDAFLAQAKVAAAKHLASLTPEIHKDARGTVTYIRLHSERHLTSGVVLCPELWAQFSPTLGTTLVALVPDRFTVYLFPRQSGAFVKLGPEVAALFSDSTYPASNEAFEISETTFKSIGNFVTGEAE